MTLSFVYLLLLLLFCFASFTCSQTFNFSPLTADKCAKILQNKTSISEKASLGLSFSQWKSIASSSLIAKYFENQEGIISRVWKNYYFPSPSAWHFEFEIYDGLHIDNKSATISLDIDLTTEKTSINQQNGTIRFPQTSFCLSLNHDSFTPKVCKADLSIYYTDKSTAQPAIDLTSDSLKGYNVQIMLISQDCGFSFISSTFGAYYSISLLEKLLFVLGCALYIIFSLCSTYLSNLERRRKSANSLRLLYLFPWIMIFSIKDYPIVQNFSLLEMYWALPFAILIIVDMAKYIYILKQSDPCYICTILICPVVAFFLTLRPEVGALAPSFFLFPEINTKHEEQQIRYVYFTWFELGNWLCGCLWIVCFHVYPNILFFTTPNYEVAVIFVSIIAVQIIILSFVKFCGERKRFHRYSFTAGMLKKHLLKDDCAICFDTLKTATEDKLYKTPCGHLFHADCLREWGGKKAECPLCRQALPDFNYRESLIL